MTAARESASGSAARDARASSLFVLPMAAILGLALLETRVAFAQDANAAAESGKLEEVVVTARRTQENIQDVPVSVTSLDDSVIAQSFGSTTADLRGVSPNVTLETLSFFGRTSNYWIRGAGLNDGEASYESPVGTVVDGVFIARTSGSVVDTFDLEDMEILRGPQGTLFGKNTTGGLINITTKRPTDAFGIEAQARVGNYGREDLFGALNLPLISGSLDTRVSVRSINSDGYTLNLLSGEREGGDDAHGIRDVTTYTGGGIFSATLSVDYLHDTGSFALVNVSNASTPGGPYFTCVVLNFCYDGNPRTTYNNAKPNRRDQDTFHNSLTLNWDLGSHTLTSVSGYHRLVDYKDPLDFTAVPTEVLEVDRYEHESEVSEDLRLESKPADGPLHYLVGLYGFREHYNFYQFAFTPLFGSDVGADYALGDTKSFAVYGSADYKLSNTVSLTVGARWSDESKDIEQTFAQNAATPVQQENFYLNGTIWPPDFVGSQRTTNFAPKASVSWKASTDVMLYASYSKGFKSGGFSDRATDAVSSKPYGDEKVDAYELGVKSELLDHTLRLNAALFRNNYTGLQRLIGAPTYNAQGQVNGTTSTILNAANAVTQGAELEANWLAASWLKVDANYGYLNAKYTSFCGSFARVGAGIPDAQCVAQTGDPNAVQNSDLVMPYAPHNSGGLSATFIQHLADDATMTYTGKVSYQSRQALFEGNEMFRPSTTTVDSNIAWTRGDGKLSFTLWGKNLTNITYPLTGGDVGFDEFAQFNEPRTYGLQANLKF